MVFPPVKNGGGKYGKIKPGANWTTKRLEFEPLSWRELPLFAAGDVAACSAQEAPRGVRRLYRASGYCLVRVPTRVPVQLPEEPLEKFNVALELEAT